GVLVVVDTHFIYRLHQSTAGTFMPEHLTRAAPVMGFTCLYGFFHGFPVHIAQHQDLAIVSVCRDAGNQAMLVKLGGQLIALLYLLYRDSAAHLYCRIFSRPGVLSFSLHVSSLSSWVPGDIRTPVSGNGHTAHGYAPESENP